MCASEDLGVEGMGTGNASDGLTESKGVCCSVVGTESWKFDMHGERVREYCRDFLSTANSGMIVYNVTKCKFYAKQ